MRRLLKIFSLLIALFVLLNAFTACSNRSKTEATAIVPSFDQKVVEEQLKAEAEKVPEPDKEAAVPADSILGEWNDINDSTRIVKITKNGEEYQYQDNDGTYPGTFADGVLTIKVSDAENDTAKVFLDSKTGNMITDYQGDIYEFSKKVD